MLEPTKQQQLDRALVGWIENRERPFLSKITSAMASNPDVESQEALQQLLIRHESRMRTFKDATLTLASTIASIPDFELQDVIWQSQIDFVMILRALEDRVFNEGAGSCPERLDLFRGIRKKYEENSGSARRNDKENWLQQWMVTYLDSIEKRLQPLVDGGEVTLPLGATASESLLAEAGFPQCWEILAYLLPRESRLRVYEPARAELLEDYLLSRSCRRGWWSSLLVDGVFLIRTIRLAGDCGRVLLASNIVQFWLWVVGAVLTWIRFMQK